MDKLSDLENGYELPTQEDIALLARVLELDENSLVLLLVLIRSSEELRTQLIMLACNEKEDQVLLRNLFHGFEQVPEDVQLAILRVFEKINAQNDIRGPL